MLSLTSEEQSAMARRGWTEDHYDRRCEINKNIWKPELRSAKSIEMKKYFADNPGEADRRLVKRWNISDEEKEEFRKKMCNINSDPNKREEAGQIIRNMWNDPAFKTKMLKRPTRNSNVGGYLCISPEGTQYEFNNLCKMIDHFSFSVSSIRKFLNSGNPVEYVRPIKNEKSNNTVNWIFYTKNYIKENGKSN